MILTNVFYASSRYVYCVGLALMVVFYATTGLANHGVQQVLIIYINPYSARG